MREGCGGGCNGGETKSKDGDGSGDGGGGFSLREDFSCRGDGGGEVKSTGGGDRGGASISRGKESEDVEVTKLEESCGGDGGGGGRRGGEFKISVDCDEDDSNRGERVVVFKLGRE